MMQETRCRCGHLKPLGAERCYSCQGRKVRQDALRWFVLTATMLLGLVTIALVAMALLTGCGPNDFSETDLYGNGQDCAATE